MTSEAASHGAIPNTLRQKYLDGFDFGRLTWPVLAVAVVASGVLLVHLSRGSSFWADDWTWIAHRRGNTVNAFLLPHNGHLSLVPVAIYRLMFAIFGLGSYTPYRALVIVLSLVVAVLVFLYAHSRAGDFIALLLTISMLFLGPGWQDTMWAFQTPWLIVCAAGIGALMLLERRTAAGDAAACALLVLAVCSTSLGLAFAVGIAIDLAVIRRRWRDGWIVLVPLLLYAIWALHYRPNQIDLSAIPTIPLNVAKAAATAMSSLVGQSGLLPFGGTATALTYGWPLLVAALVLAVWRARTVRPSARAITLGLTFAGFAASVSIVHGELASALSSRYIYVYCLLAALLIAELCRGVRVSWPAGLALCVIAVSAVVANIGNLRAQGAYIRLAGATTNGALSALNLDRTHVSPRTLARISLYQDIDLTAAAYFSAERALGSPAYSIAQLRTAPGAAQTAADSQLLADGDVTLGAASTTSGRASRGESGATPSGVAAANGTVTRTGSCVRFVPVAALAPGLSASIAFTADPGRVSVSAGAAPVSVAVRRFAGTFTPVGSVTARHAATVAIRQDPAAQPWVLQLSSIAPVTACTLVP
jgi:hypothetical protein